MRYAKPVVEKTSLRRDESAASSSKLGDEEDRAESDTVGNDENDVDIFTILKVWKCMKSEFSQIE